jgi:hypothetical protein
MNLRRRRCCRRGRLERASGRLWTGRHFWCGRGCGTRSRRDSFSFLLTGREQRGASQNADVFIHSSNWKGHIALNHQSEQGRFLALRFVIKSNAATATV